MPERSRLVQGLLAFQGAMSLVMASFAVLCVLGVGALLTALSEDGR